jgi:hypothetical protein
MKGNERSENEKRCDPHLEKTMIVDQQRRDSRWWRAGAWMKRLERNSKTLIHLQTFPIQSNARGFDICMWEKAGTTASSTMRATRRYADVRFERVMDGVVAMGLSNRLVERVPCLRVEARALVWDFGSGSGSAPSFVTPYISTLVLPCSLNLAPLLINLKENAPGFLFIS